MPKSLYIESRKKSSSISSPTTMGGGGGVNAGSLRKKNFFYSSIRYTKKIKNKKVLMTTTFEGAGKALVVGPLV